MNLYKLSFGIALLLFSGSTMAQQQLTLDQARQMALQNNKKIKQAQHGIDAAKAVQEGANTSDKPVIDGSIAAFHVGKPLNTLLPGFGVSPSLTVTQPIYAGGKIKLGKAATAKGVEIYEEQKVMTETEVLLNVDKAYWQVVSIQEKIKLGERFGILLDSLNQDLTNLYDAGMIYKNDLLRVQVQRNETELNLSKAQDGLVLSKLSLAQLIGTPGSAVFAIQDSVRGSFDAIRHDSLVNSIDNRVEIRLLTRALEAEELQRKLLKADFKPTIGVLAGGFMGVGKHMNISTGGNVMASYFGMLSVNIPIWDWGLKASKVKEQSFKIKARQEELEETKEFLSLEIQNAYLQLNQSARKIALSGASMAQAEENLRLNDDRFKAGTVTGKDVLEAQTLWQQATSNIIDAKVEYKISEAVYRKAVGENRDK